MAVEKLSVSLPEELVSDLDELAAADASSRSAVIREAAAEYVTRRTAAARERERRDRVGRAIEGFERLASEWGPDERTATELVREIRGEALGDA